MPRRPAPAAETLGDLLATLGGVSPKRVRLRPAPGTATGRDVSRLLDTENRLFELVDGTLVEKPMRARESYLAVELAFALKLFSRQNGNLGMVLGADGTLEIMPGLVRIPDVSFTAWDRVPGRVVPTEPVPDLVPDLAVEVLSRANTAGEMARKLKEYFLAGVRAVWLVDPDTRTVRVYTTPDQVTEYTVADAIDGGAVLPGLVLPVAQLFADMPAVEPKRKKRK